MLKFWSIQNYSSHLCIRSLKQNIMSEHIQTATPETTVYTLGFMVEYINDNGEPRPIYFPLLVGSGYPMMNTLVHLFQRNWLGYSGTDKPVPAIHVFETIEDFNQFVAKIRALVPHLEDEFTPLAKYVPQLSIRFLAVDATQFDLLTTIEE